MELDVRYIKFIFDSKKIFFPIFFFLKLFKTFNIFFYRNILDKIQYKEIRGYEFSIDGKYDLVIIYKLLHKHKPLNILELGSGASTLVFAQYAKEMKKNNININVISLEENAYYKNLTKRGLDNIDDNIVKLELCKTIERETDDYKFINYDFNHTISYDFIYIDGPVDKKNNIHYICDDINIIQKNKNFVALVDYRLNTYSYLRKQKNQYKCKFSFINKSGLVFSS